MTTSATGSPQRVSEVPADMIIVTQDDIRRTGADNIPDILRFVTGLDVRTYGIGQAEIAIRGYSQPPNPRLLVMVNGRQIYLDDYGYVAWSTIPVQLDEIRQIEVVKGPTSALFGFNAAGGVINIITYNPLNDDVNTATVRTGTQGLLEGSVVSTAHFGDTAGIRVSGGGLQARDFSPIGLSKADTAARTSYQHGAFNVEGRWQAAPGIELMAEGGMVESRSPAFLGGSFLDMHYRTNTLRIGGTADSDIGLFSLDLYQNQARLLYHIPLLGSEPVMNTVQVAKANDLLKLGPDNTVRLGLEFRDNSAQGVDFNEGVFNGTIGYRVYTADAMWDWQIAPRLSLTNAARVDYLALNYSGTLIPGGGFTVSDYNRTRITAPSFNSGLVWKATDVDTLKLTAARGLQAPSLDDFGTQHPGFQVSLGNPSLSPTYVWNAELGYDRSVPMIGGMLSAAVFYQRNDSLLGTNWWTNPTVLPSGLVASQAQNIGASREIGFEIGLNGKFASGFHWNASYTFGSISDRIRSEADNLAFEFDTATPRHTVILGGGYDIGKWEFDVVARWQSQFQDYRINTNTGAYYPILIDNYLTSNVHIGYKVTDFLTLSGTVQQLQSRMTESAGPPVERRLIISATSHF